LPTGSLYSLEKLIEWKQEIIDTSKAKNDDALYSLEKLIEWKQQNILPLTDE